MDSSEYIETGTTTVGLAGADGVVLAADRRASLGGRFVTNRTARKVVPVDDHTALTFAGSVGEAQSFVRQLRAERSRYEHATDRSPSVETTATVAGDLLRSGPYQHLELVLGGTFPEPAVYQVGPGGGVMDTPYAASGSGMQLAYGRLEDAYEPDHSVDTLRALATTAIRNATERDTASGDGMTIATLTLDGDEHEHKYEYEREFEQFEQFESIDAAVTATANGTGDESGTDAEPGVAS
ncbi:20S proteasome subunits A and B [Natrialba hulunbeirensis JCM 10989]|uniref:proteasome endopeptidase complex n=2 Tax=Natrialba hulunbeirensis TaxID=123783 RepID=M0ACX6_9EURY|nr:20S proteasome subunits A and B [Natrialba hulunbeirensis JCM 10989]